MQNRQYSSISIDTTLTAGGVSSTATSMTVASGTGASLMGGVTLTTNDTFAVALDPDTINEEIVFITARSGDTFTIVRARSGTSNIVHGAGATVRHVMTSDDLNWFNTTSPGTLSTTKGDIIVATGSQAVSNLPAGTNNYAIVADSTQTFGVKYQDLSSRTETLTNKTIDYNTNTITNLPASSTIPTNGIATGLIEAANIVASAATGTINIDAKTSTMWYYTVNATANFTLNFRGNSTTTLNTLMPIGDTLSVVFLNTNGSTAYYANAFTIDGTSVTPVWVGATAPTSGNASSIDAYTFTIIKTAASTYKVLAGTARFA